MNYTCSICTATVDAEGFPANVIDPLAKTMTITCFACRLAAMADRARGAPKTVAVSAARRMPRYNGKLATDRLPYKDE
jgi:hypothetical protein